MSERSFIDDDLRLAQMERDDARRGAEIWALRCGVVLGRSPIPDAPADLGRLPAETFWRAAGVHDRVRWEDRTFEERQRWAYAEGACIEKARGQAPEVQSLVDEIARLQAALAESVRKRVEAEAENGKLRAIVGFNEPGSEPMNGTQIEVLDKRQMRWMPYSAEHRRRTGKAGRWQHYAGYGWENCEPPQGPWRPARLSSIPSQETPDVTG